MDNGRSPDETRLTLPSRPVPPSDVFPDGVPTEMLTAYYTPDEMKMMAELRAQGAVDEMAAIHEMKAIFDLRPWEEPPQGVREGFCGYATHLRGWRAREQTHVVCATCHPPAAEWIVAEWYEQEPPERLRPLSNPDANTVGKYHAVPHPTEKAAAHKVAPRTGSQKRLILDAVAQAEDGLIDEEIAVVPGVHDTAHRTRRNELVMGGWVEDSGRTRLTDSDTPSIIWVLTQEGRARWREARP